MMFDRILVPLDGSALAECVLPHVIAFARVFHSQVILLQVLEQPHSSVLAQAIDPMEWQFIKVEADAYLNDVTARLRGSGLEVLRSLGEGRAAEHIVEFAHQNNIDLIALSTHGRSGLSGWNVSSVVEKISLRAYTSMLIVRAYQSPNNELADQGYRQLFVPLDGSQRAEIALPPTMMLARYYGSQLHLAHVVCKPELHAHLPLLSSELELVRQITERNRQAATKYLEEICSHSMAEVDSRLHVSEGSYAELHSLVELEGVDLVLLSAHGYSGNPKWPYGSATLSFIVYGTTPLLIVQDLDRDKVQETTAEIVAREKQEH